MRTCLQCGGVLRGIDHLETMKLGFCVNPSCPNFGLVQVSQEMMEKVFEQIEREEKV